MRNKTKMNQIFINDLATIGEQTRQIAKGDLETSHIQVETSELTELSDDINLITGTLNSYVGEISRVLSHLSVGDLSVQLTSDTRFYGDFIPIKTALEKIIHTLSGTFTNIGNIMEEIESFSEKANAATIQVAENEKLVAENMETVSQKAQEIYEKAETNHQNVGTVSVSMEQAMETAGVGNELISQLVDCMNQVNEASKNISGVTDLIFGISSQTKLLSLNASIEAARAGEQGKGFAVVAQEIGKLALQTTDAVEETGKLVEESAKQVERCQEIVENTAKCFHEIKDEIQNIMVQNHNIATTTAGQKHDIEEIVHIIEEVSGTIANNATLADHTAESNHRLHQETEKLDALLDEFVMDKNSIAEKKVIDQEAMGYLERTIRKLTNGSEREVDSILSNEMGNNAYFECAYLIHDDGKQASHTVMSDLIDISKLENFSPAMPGENHQSKKYYLQPKKNPEKLYASFEYISGATKSLCSTYSRYFTATNGKSYVLCIDMKYM